MYKSKAMFLAPAFALACLSGPASAVDSSRVYFQNATGICQPALPAFEGTIRKRPLAIANEGASVAFISCSAPRSPAEGVGGHATYGISSVSVRIYNRTGASADVGCTLITGWDAPSSTYSPKVITVGANDNEFQTWTAAADNGGQNIYQPNFSCSLPPGLDIGYFYYFYSSPVGA